MGTLSPNGRKILESYELVDGVCKEVYRNVPVTEQLIKAVPSPYEAAQTAGIAVVATTAALSTPFLVRIIKPVVKKLLTKAKEIVTRKQEARPSLFSGGRRSGRRGNSVSVGHHLDRRHGHDQVTADHRHASSNCTPALASSPHCLP